MMGMAIKATTLTYLKHIASIFGDGSSSWAMVSMVMRNTTKESGVPGPSSSFWVLALTLLLKNLSAAKLGQVCEDSRTRTSQTPCCSKIFLFCVEIYREMEWFKVGIRDEVEPESSMICNGFWVVNGPSPPFFIRDQSPTAPNQLQSLRTWYYHFLALEESGPLAPSL